MAAGDVTIQFDSRRSIRGYRRISGTVVLDGGNPTPVALASYVREVKGGNVSIQGTAAPGDDPMAVTCAASGTTLNVYAWKSADGTDPTLVASTDNARIIHFDAWGIP